MKSLIHRETFRIVMCLLLGVATTVAVAWGLAWSRPYDWRPPLDGGWPSIGGFGSTSSGRWLASTGHYPGTTYVSRMADYQAQVERWPSGTFEDVTSEFPRWSRVLRPAVRLDFDLPANLPIESVREQVEFAHGWPNLALWSEIDYWSASVLGRSGLLSGEGGFLISQYSGAMWFSDLRSIPVTPILPGFLINTLFYAVIWFGLFFGVGALRKAIRRGRGRCVKCGYDLRGHRHYGQDARATGCPECGWNRSEPRP